MASTPRKEQKVSNTRSRSLPKTTAPSKGGRNARVSVPKSNSALPNTPKSVALPIDPTRDERPLIEEQNIARVEILMLKGVRDRRQLGQMLGIDSRAISRLMDKVLARWEITGGGMDIARHRGEAIRKLDQLESGLWETLDTTPDVRAKIATAKTLVDVIGKAAEMRGINKTQAEHPNVGAKHNLMAEIEQKKAVQKIALKFQEILDRKRRERESMISTLGPDLRAESEP